MTNESALPYTKSNSLQMFDRISDRYDFLNRLLSFGLDVGWRKSLAKHLPNYYELEILDLATGTGDVLLYLFSQMPNITKAYGVDLAARMLSLGRRKVHARG